jgi:hypothetical protein
VVPRYVIFQLRMLEVSSLLSQHNNSIVSRDVPKFPQSVLRWDRKAIVRSGSIVTVLAGFEGAFATSGANS